MPLRPCNHASPPDDPPPGSSTAFGGVPHRPHAPGGVRARCAGLVGLSMGVAGVPAGPQVPQNRPPPCAFEGAPCGGSPRGTQARQFLENRRVLRWASSG